MSNEIDRANAFAADLAREYGDQLVSVVLYGSAARGEYREGRSDLNVLVLLRDTRPETLRRGSELARGWVAERNPPPLMLSEAEWRASADVFPIELADIREAHRVLRGADPFGEVRIDPAHLRLQCEHELKAKHIRLREGYLLSAGEPKELESLLLDSFSTFLVLFRTVLRLSGGDGAGAGDPERVVRRTAELAEIDPAPLLEVHRARTAGRRLDVRADSPVVTGYLRGVEGVVHYVDRFVHGAA